MISPGPASQSTAAIFRGQWNGSFRRLFIYGLDSDKFRPAINVHLQCLAVFAHDRPCHTNVVPLSL